MRPYLTSLALLVLATACAATGPQQQSERPPSPAERDTFSIVVAQRFMDEDDWGDLDEPTAINLTFDRFAPYDAVGFELGMSFAEDSAGPLDSEIWEAFAGVRKTFMLADDHLRPYFAAGASWSIADVSGGPAEFEDDNFGFYLRAGAYWIFGGGLALGVDARKLFGADYSESGVDADASFDQVGVLLGYSF